MRTEADGRNSDTFMAQPPAVRPGGLGVRRRQGTTKKYSYWKNTTGNQTTHAGICPLFLSIAQSDN